MGHNKLTDVQNPTVREINKLNFLNEITTRTVQTHLHQHNMAHKGIVHTNLTSHSYLLVCVPLQDRI